MVVEEGTRHGRVCVVLYRCPADSTPAAILKQRRLFGFPLPCPVSALGMLAMSAGSWLADVQMYG
jgi:hypothetical protein